MKVLRICLNSFVLAVGCLVSILVGFGFFHMLRAVWPVDQILVQAPVAVIVLIMGFTAWYLVISRPALQHLRLVGWGEFTAVFLLSLVWTPLIFLPLHYLTQGYLSTIDNILAIFYFQVPANFIALLTATWLVKQPVLLPVQS
jgi:hypothetical protein